jgi:hypothetical protein
MDVTTGDVRSDFLPIWETVAAAGPVRRMVSTAPGFPDHRAVLVIGYSLM